MYRVCMGWVCYGPSLLCAELTQYHVQVSFIWQGHLKIEKQKEIWHMCATKTQFSQHIQSICWKF